jgi:hypothetical protein
MAIAGDFQNQAWLLKNSLPEKCSEKLRIQGAYKRRSRFG